MLPLLASLVLAQAPAPAAVGYTRFVTKTDGTLEMDTAAQRLVAPGKPTVWLVGAIHIGSKPYYTSVQRLLDYSDQVFYEGVKAGPNAPNFSNLSAPKPGAPTPVYKILSDAIGLDFQLLDIDYRKPNWTNVDLTWAELDALNKAAANGRPSQFDQIKGFLDPAGSQAKMMSSVLGMATPGMKEAIKILLVKAAGSGDTPGMDPVTEAIILKARNKAVVDALAAASSAPNPPTSIAVFYGAGHMPDLQATLVEKYGYRLDEKRWFPAATADPKKVDATGQAMLAAMEKMLASKTLPQVPAGGTSTPGPSSSHPR